jgi:hypothetical protein
MAITFIAGTPLVSIIVAQLALKSWNLILGRPRPSRNILSSLACSPLSHLSIRGNTNFESKDLIFNSRSIGNNGGAISIILSHRPFVDLKPSFFDHASETIICLFSKITLSHERA